MSTYIYLVCLDHDPPLIAEEESGQHFYDLPRIRGEIKNREEIVRVYDDRYDLRYKSDWGEKSIEAYFRIRSARFLSRHPKCHIGIRDEYGRDYQLYERTPPTDEARTLVLEKADVDEETADRLGLDGA